MTLPNQEPPSEIQPPDAKGEPAQVSPVKKKFVEPSISRPVGVLEATTYFQAVDSGGTGRPRSI